MRKRQIFCLFIFLSIGLLSDAVLLAQKPTSQPLSQTFGDMTQDLDHGKIYRESPDIPRPPQPTGKREDNCYQENFLKPSNGTSVTVATPDTPKPADTQKPVPKTATNHAGAILLTIILLTSCLLGGYIYMDHRYRIWLHSVIEQNNIIVASSAPDISTEISGALTFEPAIVNGQILFSDHMNQMDPGREDYFFPFDHDPFPLDVLPEIPVSSRDFQVDDPVLNQGISDQEFETESTNS